MEIVICPHCNGCGLRASIDYDDCIDYSLCSDCNGTGRQVKEVTYRDVTVEDFKTVARG